MQQHFLCPNHSRWLADNPIAAINHLSNCQDTGLYYIENDLPKQALPYLGCAYETAEILLTTAHQQASTRIRAFTASCVALAKALVNTHQSDQAQLFYAQGKNRLYCEYEKHQFNTVTLACVSDCIMALTKGEEALSHYASDNLSSMLTH